MRGNQQVFIVFGLFVCLILGGQTVHAQLITDSDARLKSSVRKREGFFSNQRKKRTPSPSQKPVFERKSSPRYSAPISFQTGRVRSVKPRVSPAPSFDTGFSFFKSDRSRNKYAGSQGGKIAKTRVQPRYSQPQQSGVLSLSAPVRTSSGSPFSVKDFQVKPRYSIPNNNGALSLARAPRYSSGSPFKPGEYKVSPRYSKPVNKSALALTRAPRYSPGSPFRPRDYNIKPRYSKGSGEGVLSLASSPRYSPGSPFKSSDHQVKPRYSQQQGEKVLSLARAPRYSPGSPFSAKDKKVNPRYSRNTSQGAITLAKSPRYSPGSPFTRKDVTIRPRYSSEVEYPSWVYNVKPKYSPDPPFLREQYRVNPRYSINKKYSIKRYWQLRTIPIHRTMADYSGPIKIKGDKKRDFHPSASYLIATHASSAQLKDAYRSWSILWNRMYGNNAQPPAVTDKVSKPKFDRKEREIWNN